MKQTNKTTVIVPDDLQVCEDDRTQISGTDCMGGRAVTIDGIAEYGAKPNAYHQLKCWLGFHKFIQIPRRFCVKGYEEETLEIRCERCGIHSPATPRYLNAE